LGISILLITSEQALYISSVRGASVKAETETKCVTLGRETLTSILGDKV
jgi:cGMP-dependent protein kinase